MRLVFSFHFFSFFVLFYWSIVALQCYVSFCCTMKGSSYTYTYISPSWTSLPPPPIPLIQVITEHQAELPVLYSRFPLASYITHGSVYMSILISQFIPSPLLPMSTCLFSTSTSLFLPCKQVHLYHFSRFHIYTLTYDICFSLSDLLHSV